MQASPDLLSPALTRRSLLIGFAATAGVMRARPVRAGETTGIIMVGASWCPFCKSAAAQLYRARAAWGWPILIASLDHQPIPPFEEFIPSQGHPLSKDVARLPTTLVVTPSQNEILAVFEGYDAPFPYLAQLATALDRAQAGDS